MADYDFELRQSKNEETAVTFVRLELPSERGNQLSRPPPKMPQLPNEVIGMILEHVFDDTIISLRDFKPPKEQETLENYHKAPPSDRTWQSILLLSKDYYAVGTTMCYTTCLRFDHPSSLVVFTRSLARSARRRIREIEVGIPTEFRHDFVLPFDFMAQPWLMTSVFRLIRYRGLRRFTFHGVNASLECVAVTGLEPRKPGKFEVTYFGGRKMKVTLRPKAKNEVQGSTDGISDEEDDKSDEKGDDDESEREVSDYESDGEWEDYGSDEEDNVQEGDGSDLEEDVTDGVAKTGDNENEPDRGDVEEVGDLESVCHQRAD